MASTSQSLPLTRSKTDVWLIGQPEPHLPENVLPTTADVLKTFFYFHKLSKKTISESASLTANQLIDVWNKARIPMTYQPHVVSKIKSHGAEYILMTKNKSRKGGAQMQRKNAFLEKMMKIFDIAHQKADGIMKIAEDRIFLEDQRNARMMKMDGVDYDLVQKEERSERRREDQDRRREEEEKRKLECTLISDVSSPSSDDESQIHEDYEIEIPLHYKNHFFRESCVGSSCDKKLRLVENMLSSADVASTLDRINLSDQKFAMLAAAIAKANGQDIENVSLSRSTIRRKRKIHRSNIDNHVRNTFSSVQKVPLVVHWDSKIMKNTTLSTSSSSTSSTDRLAVVVTGQAIEKILGIVKIPSGTGSSQAKATFELMGIWDVTSNVVGMGFDTTASNTGAKNGACVLLERLLERNLLHFSCRHHIHEVVISEVFSVLFGASSGPNISLFERFKKFWPQIDPTNYKSIEDSLLHATPIQQLCEEVVPRLQTFFSADCSFFPRGDYKEMVELALLFLNIPSSSAQFHFQHPGAYHMARWMAKVIYCFKIYAFRKQFKLTVKEERSLEEFCLFAALVYVESWISCTIACDAPRNDLNLLRKFKMYENVNKEVSQAATRKLQNHLWYLGPEMVPLSLFSTKVSDEEKRLIVSKLIQSGDDWSTRGIKYPSKNCDELLNKRLHELVNSSSTAALQTLGLDVRVLADLDPQSWNNLQPFQDVNTAVQSLSVVNDSAERSIALMSVFNDSITKSEKEMQKLVQVVEENRKRIPDTRKTTLSSYLPC